MTAIIIRPAVVTDLPGVLALLEQNDLPSEGLRDHFGTALVARMGAELVGSAALEIYGTAGLLRSVAVAAPLRGQGLGQRLTQAALDLARQRDLTDLYLLTETAGAFFPRFGFKPVSRAEVIPAVQQSAEFSGACPESALVMRLQLIES